MKHYNSAFRYTLQKIIQILARVNELQTMNSHLQAECDNLKKTMKIMESAVMSKFVTIKYLAIYD